jgi:hypothetical protein
VRRSCAAEVAQSVDRLLILAHGRLAADAALDELARPDQTLEDTYLQLTAARVAAAGAGLWRGGRAGNPTDAFR